uniref:Uncharacterized protein n=1 Tax=Arundo donax TaxID=35708 RepID=A0A0A9AH46_ARUDO
MTLWILLPLFQLQLITWLCSLIIQKKI